MLFNSHIFIFIFLPIVLLGFYLIGRSKHYWAACWLAMCSLFFYAWWDVRFLWILLGSIVFNYTARFAIGHAVVGGQRKLLLLGALTANLSLLAYYKYSNFFLENLNTLLGCNFLMGAYFLPLGISFFTFTQIAFLVDTYKQKASEYNFAYYMLFVTYFPHLIAGPVLHHQEMMPQFSKPSTYRFNYDNMMVGLVIFFIGLFKKTVLADGFSVYVTPVFASTLPLSFLDAWGGALCYSLQLYFDFSGYSDMAIGLSRLFGIVLPLNFNSPYKAINIIEFWRRWHMTLSRFLRDYVYIPLGGNRNGASQRSLNVMLTMFLGGLWHGAGWTFVLWGSLHGVYLILNHAWHRLRKRLGQDPDLPCNAFWRTLSTLLTFLLVVIAWVIFRAENINTAFAMLKAMAGGNGFVLPEDWLAKWGTWGQFLQTQGVSFNADNPLIKAAALNWIVVGLSIVWLAPNTQHIMAGYYPIKNANGLVKRWRWQPTWANLVLSLASAVYAVLSISKLSEFIYFQF